MAQEWPKMIQNAPKMTQNGPKITPGFTHFFRNFFFTEKAVPQTFSLLECVYLPLVDMEKYKSVHFLVGASNNLSRGSAEMQPKVMMGANISPLYN